MSPWDGSGPAVRCGVAGRALPGESVSGDMSLVRHAGSKALVAVLDGLGHGPGAREAAQRAVAALESASGESVISLVKRCHAALRGSRGVVMSLAEFDSREDTLTWLGVGNVDGLLIPALDENGGSGRIALATRGGVVGDRLPPLQGAVIPLSPGDQLIFSTDGIHPGYRDNLPRGLSPQEAADHILSRFAEPEDDALVLVARYEGRRT